ncbi:PREDICTED: uncharacterized protein LOC109127264 [Camelina sativa]|uniref:Uncharacterized protein LOC109127264 n=1 Tax=Camelina sativa TaxID=90675 RepID=A0ABM1QKU2_CAMSA|nr:PREDICTED: uncharacterized protein LOC109127264 [Camelina sativa]
MQNARNELIFKGKEINPQDTVRKALEDADEWKHRKQKEDVEGTLPVSRSIIDQKWRPPSEDWVKCNTDGAWNGVENQSGTGWVLRDKEGSVKWIGAQAIRRAKSAIEVELEAIRRALVMLSRLNYDRIIVESDSLGAVNLLNNEEIWPVFAPMLQDIHDFFR